MTTIAAGQSLTNDEGISSLAVDAQRIYWRSGNTVMAAPRDGSGTPAVLATNALGFAIDATDIYWTTMAANGSVRKMPLGGSTSVALTDRAVGAGAGIALDGQYVWWVNRIAEPVHRVVKTGGTDTTMAMFAGDPQTSQQRKPWAIVATTDGAYITSTGGAQATRGSISLITTLSSAQVAVDLNLPHTIVASPTHVYWAASADGYVQSMTRSAARTKTVLQSSQPAPTRVAIDATSIYWTNRSNGTIMKAPRDGGIPTVVADGQSMPTSVAVDETHLYWLNSGDGTVRRTTK